jgi:hypothetical protein
MKETRIEMNHFFKPFLMAALAAILFVVCPATSYGQVSCDFYCTLQDVNNNQYPVLYFAPEGTTTTLGVGYLALGGGPTGTNTSSYGTGIGYEALYSNTSGEFNTAVGASALQSNTTGPHNTAIGTDAAVFTTTGGDNDAMGYGALYANTTGAGNTAIGFSSLTASNSSGNTAVGSNTCGKVTSASNVICIGSGVAAANTSNTTWVAGIYNTTLPGKNNPLVCVDKLGQLGTKGCATKGHPSEQQEEINRKQQEMIDAQAHQIADLQGRLSRLESLIGKQSQ